MKKIQRKRNKYEIETILFSCYRDFIIVGIFFSWNITGYVQSTALYFYIKKL